MMFLIRVAFWLSVVVMLLPTGGSNKTAGQDDVGATQALSAAGAALADMRGFARVSPMPAPSAHRSRRHSATRRKPVRKCCMNF